MLFPLPCTTVPLGLLVPGCDLCLCSWGSATVVMEFEARVLAASTGSGTPGLEAPPLWWRDVMGGGGAGLTSPCGVAGRP